MKMMTVQGSPVVRYVTAAAAMVIVVFGLKYASDFVAPMFFAATLAILFTPALRWLEKKGLHTGLALLVMALGLGGLTVSLQQLALRLPAYQELLLQRIDAFIAALGSIGIDLQGALNAFVVDTTALARSAITAALELLSNRVAIVFFLFLLFLMLVESKSIATKFQKFLLTRVDFAVLWGFLAFILGFIPNVGLILAILPAVIIAFILYGWGTAVAILAMVIILNAAMDNAVTPRIMGKGLNLPILLVFLSFLFWSWVFGFVGALLAIPATLFVKTLLQGRQETRFLAVLLSGQGGSDATVTIPADRQDENNTVDEHSDSPDTRRATLTVDSTDSPVHEE